MYKSAIHEALVFQLFMFQDGSGMVQGSDGSGMVPAWFRDGSGMVQGWFKVSYKICVNLYCSRRSFAFGQ